MNLIRAGNTIVNLDLIQTADFVPDAQRPGTDEPDARTDVLRIDFQPTDGDDWRNRRTFDDDDARAVWSMLCCRAMAARVMSLATDAAASLDALRGAPESAHREAEDILCSLLREIGHPDAADAFERARTRVGFWYE